MAFIGASRVKETSITQGPGNLTLAGAFSAKFKAFSAVAADGDVFKYVIEHQSADEVEWGIGTYVSATPAIARTLVLGSTNAGAAVNFSAGTKHVFMSPLGERDGYLDGYQKFQSFVLEFYNNAGTIQHRVVGSTTNVEAAAFADRITGASDTLQNTPSVASGVNFTAGVGIVSGSTQIAVLNTAAQDDARYAPIIANVEFYNGGVSRPNVYSGITSRNVNGTTIKRPEFTFVNPTTGANWPISTTNLPTNGHALFVRIAGYMA